MALVLPRGEIFLWGRNFCRIILGILAALLAAKTVRNRTKPATNPTKPQEVVQRNPTKPSTMWRFSNETEPVPLAGL